MFIIQFLAFETNDASTLSTETFSLGVNYGEANDFIVQSCRIIYIFSK